MKYRPFGNTGFETSEIGFGAWAIGGSWGEQAEEDSIAALHKALDMGVNFIDTAEGYGNGKSEQIIAKVLKEREDTVFVATKTPPAPGPWPPSPYDKMGERYSEEYLRTNVENRLKLLDTDCIDLLQLHTWTRAWNNNPEPFAVLKQLKQEGKIRFAGISTPEHDQNCVIELMRGGWVDSVQVIYNLFEQEPAAELLPVAEETGTAIIVRVAFDEGSLTGKWEGDHVFPRGDFRQDYFAGDRLSRTVNRVNQIKPDAEAMGLDMPSLALKFSLGHPAVSNAIPGMRNVRQAEMNCGVSDLRDLTEDEQVSLRRHRWNRAFWYGGK